MDPIDSFGWLKDVHAEIREAIKSLRSRVDDAANTDDYKISVQKEQELLERTIDNVTKESVNHVVKLKMRMNALAPITRLPEEILCLIILFTGKPTVHDPGHYLRYTWVCHRWRSILISDSRFWSFIRHASRGGVEKYAEEFYDELVRRSKSAKLDVALFDVYYSKEDFAAKFFASESDRIRTWSIDVGSLRDLDISNMSFPSLRCFIIVGAYETARRLVDLLTPVLAACRNLEMLSFVITDGMRVDQLPTIFKRLKDLALLHNSGSLQFMDSVLALLHNNASLQSLRIRSYYSSNDNSLSCPNNVITLPELQSLEGSYPFALESIRAPKISYVDVSSPFRSNIPGRPLFEGFDFSSILHLYVSTTCLSGSVKPPICPVERELECLSDGFFDYPKQGFHVQHCPMNQLQPILSIILPPSINLIELRLLVSCEYYDLQEILVSAPFIQKLVISKGDELPNFIRLLCNVSILARLKKLFYGPLVEPIDFETTYAYETGKTLTACLESRKRSTVYELESIKLLHCPELPPVWLQEINKLGTEVITYPNPSIFFYTRNDIYD